MLFSDDNVYVMKRLVNGGYLRNSGAGPRRTIETGEGQSTLHTVFLRIERSVILFTSTKFRNFFLSTSSVTILLSSCGKTNYFGPCEIIALILKKNYTKVI